MAICTRTARRQTAAAVLTCVLFGCTTSVIAQTDAANQAVALSVNVLPADVARYWAWLPADTETAIVARDVAFTAPMDVPAEVAKKLTEEQRLQLQQRMPIEIAKWVALGPVPMLGGGNFMQSGKYMKLLGEVKAPLVVYGGRGYRPVSAFGGMRYHGASVMAFAEEDAAAVDAWLAALEKEASEVRMVGERKALVFPFDKDQMEPAFKVEPWQGTYFVRVAPNVVVAATSDAYLAEMIARIDGGGDRALPSGLPEWKYVDTSASVWGLRHIPPSEGQKLAGVVWLAAPAGRQTFEVYMRWIGEPDLNFVGKSWLRDQRSEGAEVAAKREEYVEALADGTAKVTLPLEEVGRTISLPIFPFFVLPGTPGAW